LSSFPVHRVCHGQTSSYQGDAGLTELGVRQASDRGRALARAVRDDEPYAASWTWWERRAAVQR